MKNAMTRVDTHAHLFRGIDGIPDLNRIARDLGFSGMVIAGIPRREIGNHNPAALAAKARRPEFYYCFAGLDHSAKFTGGRVTTPSLAAQAETLAALGADGFKLIESKPTLRRELGEPVDGPYYAAFFARVETLGLPLLWHTADPEEFWDPAATPAWAASRGWAYGPGWLPKERHYAETEAVLARHPRLRVIFPHFYFLSADLPRAGAFLARFPNVFLDLAPGVELIFTLGANRDAARDFFVRHADRIVFGTDIGIIPEATVSENVHRARLVTRFLETDEEFGHDPEADFVLEPLPGARARGLALPPAALEKIYSGNFRAIAGAAPRVFDRARAREECRRLAGVFDALPGEKTPALHPARAAEMMEA